METTNNTNPVQQEDKTVAILAYITLIGYIIAIVMHGTNKTKLGSYHLKQATGLIITSVGLWFVMMILMFVPVIGFIMAILSPFVWIGVLVFVILGIVNASGGQEKPLPLIGPMFEKMFANAFN